MNKFIAQKYMIIPLNSFKEIKENNYILMFLNSKSLYNKKNLLDEELYIVQSSRRKKKIAIVIPTCNDERNTEQEDIIFNLIPRFNIYLSIQK